MTAASGVRLGGFSRTLVLVDDLPIAGRIKGDRFQPRLGFTDVPLSAENLRAIADLLVPVTAADQPTTEPSAPWADEPTTWVEDDHVPDKVMVCQGTRASSSAILVPRDAVPLLIQQLTALAPALQPAADTEREERLRAARNVAAFLRTQDPDAHAMGLSKGERTVILSLDDEITRLDVVVTEQAATVERVDAVVDTTRSSGQCDLRDRLDAPLGSQRTQGRG